MTMPGIGIVTGSNLSPSCSRIAVNKSGCRTSVDEAESEPCSREYCRLKA